MVAAGRLSDLRWPNFSDYSVQVKSFYETSNYASAWLKDGEPTQQATAVIEVLKQADSKGLNAEDYDGSRWPARVSGLRQSPSSDAQARFDAALTVCIMRYISDLHIGRVNPRHFKFNLDVGPKKYDLPAFLREKVVNGSTIEAELDGVEPPFAGYKRTQQTLARYVALARQDDGEQLPVPAKPIEPGASYAGVPRLTRLLRLLGDLPADADLPDGSNVYAGPLVAAVQNFQKRHGLAPDGRLGPQTLKQLNTPLTFRVEQLRLTLERWRWVPYQFTQPPIVVNIPEFRLRAYDSAGKVGLASNVIVGKAYRHETPVFERDMKFVVFRPYWNVPPSIRRSEIVPAIQRDRNYVANKGYEVTTAQGAVVTAGLINDETLQQLRSGKLQVRQKPGPSNALGLVKLMFPNEYNVYLHSTPSQALFAQSRRDFSHGCIRVEQAAELAAWVLRDKPEWTLERVRNAMQSGSDNLQINLTKPVPVLILYGTAVVDEQDQVHFFDDIYGYDSALEKVLALGYPYPG
ncbi:MAG TPA: L,D-transpeptidase family protein [Terriglobales bacterium]|nr:L,D-transpeptidase family protein [Terriglobales bacterium]